MAITINGTGSITGLTAGGLPDGIITSADLASGAITAGSLPTGSILQVVSATKTDTVSTTSTTYGDISGLSVSITPSSTDSQILLMATLTMSESAVVRTFLKFAGGNSGTGYEGDSGTGIQCGTGFGPRINDSWMFMAVPMLYLDSPATTDSTTYSVQWRVDTGTTKLNGSHTSDSSSPLAASTITAMEVAG